MYPYSNITACIYTCSLSGCALYRCGDISEVAGFVGYPLKASKCETLAHVLLKFKGGVNGVLHAHFMDIPMHKLPFFQIFGEKVFSLMV